MTPSFGCVVVTQGSRPNDVQRAVESVLTQKSVETDLVVVGNGCEPAGLPSEARALALRENIGATAGRNAGAAQAAGELLVFLDDDAYLAEDDTLARVGEMFERDATLGALQLRLADPAGRPEPRHWVPRLRVGDRSRSSDVVALCEGATVARRSVFEEIGGWPAEFFYFHEGIDLAWRILDRGYHVWYAGDLLAMHPAPAARERRQVPYLAARNRVWLARRNLPWPLATVHVAVWALRTGAGLRSRRDAREAVRGYRDGLREPAGSRKPVRWRTIWRMTRAGRPPVI